MDSLKSDSDSNTSKLFATPEELNKPSAEQLTDRIKDARPTNDQQHEAATEINIPIEDAPSANFVIPATTTTTEFVEMSVDPDSNVDDDEDDDKTPPDDTNEEFEYTDEDLDEALQNNCDTSVVAVPSITISDDDALPPPLSHLPDNLDLIPCEGHYMPMTPKRLISRENSDMFPMDTDASSNGGGCDSRQTPINSPSMMANDVYTEENHYVEMTQGKIISVLSDDFKSNYETICIAPPRDSQEPVYMELSHSINSVAVLKPINTNLSNLPDILNATQVMTMKRTTDSSEDERERERVDALKESNLVSRTMKPKTRFSLSDTFRPASYYLGPTTTLKECADSSDSEIVSPPPIPKSPPPLEDLRGSAEAFQAENFDTIKRKQRSSALNKSFEEAIPKFSASDLALHKAEAHKTSRLSLPDQLYTQKYGPGKRKLDLAPHDYLSLSTYSVENKTYTASVTSCNTDDGSNTSSDYDLYNKLKLESPSFVSADSVYNSNRSLTISAGTASETEGGGADPQLELRDRQSDSETERRNKRRPLSEDSFSELELAAEGHTFDVAPEHSHLDQYLGKLSQPSYNYTESTDQSNWIQESLAKIGEIHYIEPPEVFRTENDSFYENLTMIAKQQLATAATSSTSRSASRQSISNAEAAAAAAASVYDTVPDRSAQKVVTLKEKNLSLHNAHLESEDRKSGFNLNAVPLQELDQQSVNCTAPIHSRGNSNVSDGSAPYYYSDLCRSGEVAEVPTTTDEAKLLNNQRDIEKRKHGISHIHNPLQEASFIAKPSASEIDTRNLYETTAEGDKQNAKNMHKESAALALMKKSDNHTKDSPPKCVNTLMTTTTNHSAALHSNTLHHPHHPNNNMSNHHHHIHGEGSSSSGTQQQQQQHLVKTNNMAGIKYSRLGASSDALLMGGGVENILYNTTSHLQSPDGGTSVDTAGDQLWEEDALWRDRLRRVSHQHARSMDDLDRIGSPQPSLANTPTPIAHSRMASTNDEEEELSVSPSKGKTTTSGRISRGVKYVNEETKSNSLRRKVYRKKASDKSRSPSLRNSQADSDEEADRRNSVMMAVTSGKEDNENDNDNDVYVQLAVNSARNGSAGDLYETLLMEDLRTKKTMDLDREKIRQWDFMSSGLMKATESEIGVSVGRRSLDSSSNSNNNGQGKKKPDPMRVANQRFSADHSTAATAAVVGKRATDKAVSGGGGGGSGGGVVGEGTPTRTRGMAMTKGYSSGIGHISSSGSGGTRQSK